MFPFIAAAFADTGEVFVPACAGEQLATLPPDGAEDVPVDVRPVVVLPSWCGGESWFVEVFWEGGMDDHPIGGASEVQPPFSFHRLPELGLEPEQRYLLVVRDGGAERAEIFRFEFKTGSRRASRDPGVPEFVLEEIVSEGTLHTASLYASPVTGDGLLLLRAGVENVAVTSGSGPRTVTWTSEQEPDKTCFSAIELGPLPAGWIGPSEETCPGRPRGDVRGPRPAARTGCGHAAPLPSGSALSLLVLLRLAGWFGRAHGSGSP